MTTTFELESFGPEYVRPAPRPCPNCPCCTEALCERGRVSVHRCTGLTPAEHRALVYNCPCSSALTRGTHAWRAERYRATRRATEQPLPPAVEVALRALARGETTDDLRVLALLRVGGFAAELAGETFVCTELGHLYLRTRREARFPTPVEVLSVDTRERTAQCVVVGWHLTRPVTVLLDLLLVETGLSAAQLLGEFLEAYANCWAADADDVVLTRVTVAPPLPEGWMDLGEEPGRVDGAPEGGDEA